MPLGQGIGDMVDAVRDRVELSSHGETWHVTAGSFDGAMAFVRERFDAPVVLSRKDRGRWWTRVTLVVTEDPSYAASAPSLDELAHPAVVEPAVLAVDDVPEEVAGDGVDSDMPAMLEEMFARQDGPLQIPRQRRRR